MATKVKQITIKKENAKPPRNQILTLIRLITYIHVHVNTFLISHWMDKLD